VQAQAEAPIRSNEQANTSITGRVASVDDVISLDAIKIKRAMMRNQARHVAKK
jgi:hypothetical protein